MGRSLLARAALFASLLLLPACFDDIADPTQGFLQVDVGEVSGVEVFVDDQSQGGTMRVGPLDVGPHTVRVVRDGYESFPPEMEIEVRPAETTLARFALALARPGSAHIAATDEMRGGEIAGAEILVDLGSGFRPTGRVTPATVDSLPPGRVRFVVRADGFAESSPREVTIVSADTVSAAAAVGPPRAVLAEMFTYTLCPNCPVSSEHLWGMFEGNARRFYAIEWHVIPSLPFYSPYAVARQAYYGSVATPAVVFQGGTYDDPPVVLSSTSAALAEYDRRFGVHSTSCSNDCPVALVIDGSIDASVADVTVRTKWRGGSLPSNLMLRVLVTENDIRGVVPANTDHFHFVPRALEEEAIVFGAAGEVVSKTYSFDMDPSWEVPDVVVIAFVQSDANHEVLAVGGLP